MASLITKGLGSPQQLITGGLGPVGVTPPVQIIRGSGGSTASGPNGNFGPKKNRYKDDEDRYIEKWIIKISGECIYNRVEKEIDTREHFNVDVLDIDSNVDKSAGQFFTVEVNQLRINSE